MIDERAAECAGKAGFATRPHAARVMREMLRARSRRGGKLGTYRCRTCRLWHIGSAVGDRSARRVARAKPALEEDLELEGFSRVEPGAAEAGAKRKGRR